VRMIAELETQPIAARRPTGRRRGCLGKVLALVLVGILASVLYLTLPGRIEVLLLGLDRAPDGSDIARTDTMIYLAAWPAEGRAALLSIPRDLWVAIPGVGENRINAAHFFAEAETAGRGPYGAMTTINQHFGTDARYFVRVRFSAVESFVDARRKSSSGHCWINSWSLGPGPLCLSRWQLPGEGRIPICRSGSGRVWPSRCYGLAALASKRSASNGRWSRALSPRRERRCWHPIGVLSGSW